MIKRFHIGCNTDNYTPYAEEDIDLDGDWVRYEDHAEKVRELQRASEADDLHIYELEEEIAELKRQLLRYREEKSDASLDEVVRLWPAGTI